MTPSRQSFTRSDSVLMRMPGETLVEQPMTGFGIQLIFWEPSSSRMGSLVSRSRMGIPISIRHMRQLPTTLSLGW